jgi:hypothetical protein
MNEAELVTKNSNKFEESSAVALNLAESSRPDQSRQLNLRREVAALKFVTPDQFEQGCTAIDSRIAKQLAELKSKLEAAVESAKIDKRATNHSCFRYLGVGWRCRILGYEYGSLIFRLSFSF